ATPTPTATPPPTPDPGDTETPTPVPTSAVLDFFAVADTYVLENLGSSNFGSALELKIDPRSGRLERTLVRFDVSSIPAGATINSATLTLCPTSVNVLALGRIHHAHRVREDWGEATANWGNQPAVLEPDTAGATYIGGLFCIGLAIDEDVQAWVDGAPNYGWQVADENEGTAGINLEVRYGSRENATSSLRPVLTVFFTP
ncbi:MAG: DNRLRE domain-containing protein, partial [Dehalococcoidia bacterium]